MHEITQGIYRETIDGLFQINVVSGEAIQYSCEVTYLPTGNVLYRTESFVDPYWVRHVVRQVVKRMSLPPRRRRKGLVNDMLALVEREQYFLDTGLYPGR